MPDTKYEEQLKKINDRLRRLEDRTDALKLLVTIAALAAAAWLTIKLFLNYAVIWVIPAG